MYIVIGSDTVMVKGKNIIRHVNKRTDARDPRCIIWSLAFRFGIEYCGRRTAVIVVGSLLTSLLSWLNTLGQAKCFK